MDNEMINMTLERFRAYAKATRIEWEGKNPHWMPSWVMYFEFIDTTLSNNGPLPDDWERK